MYRRLLEIAHFLPRSSDVGRLAIGRHNLLSAWERPQQGSSSRSAASSATTSPCSTPPPLVRQHVQHTMYTLWDGRTHLSGASCRRRTDTFNRIPAAGLHVDARRGLY